MKDIYIEQFIDTNKEHYLKYIANKKVFSDGCCYTGYLWECLLKYNQVTMRHVFKELSNKEMVLVFWDIHSCEKIHIENYWRFPKDRVIKVDSKLLNEGIEYLPKDVYIFDYDFTWTYILTHEDDGKRRICYELKKQ